MLGGRVETPVVHTVHGPLDGDAGVGIYEASRKLAPQVGLDLDLDEPAQARSRISPGWRTARTRSTSTPIPCSPERGEYLLFLGRLSPDKGAHRAIEIAHEAGLPLKIAGKMREHARAGVLRRAGARRILGDDIEYLGETSHATKVDLLQNARATLFPIDWEEPFGLVMIESMACGTPVIATRRGAVPEVVEHGRSGIIVDDYREMVAAIAEADKIEPLECRRSAEEHFSAERMVRTTSRSTRPC